MRAAANRGITPFLWLIVMGLAIRFIWISAGVMTRHSDGFAAYYTAGRLLRSGEGGAKFYDDAFFGSQVAHLVPGVRDIYNANPPTTAFLAFPLSWTSYDAARTAWMVLTIAFLAASLFLIVRETKLQGLFVPAFIGLSLASQPLEANVRQGQAYVLLLLLAVLTWIGFRRRHNAIAGISLGAMLVLKTAGLFIPLLFLVRRRFGALAWGLVTISGTMLIALAVMGLGAWRAYVVALIDLGREPDLSVTAYQTVTSLFHHVFIYDARWNPNPEIAAPLAGRLLPLLVAAAMIATTVVVLLRSHDDDLAFAILLTLTIVLSPVSLDYHYTLMLLPVAMVMAQLQSSRFPSAWPILVVSIMLMFSNLQQSSSRFNDGALAILAYPKLAGGLLLWGHMLWHMYRQPVTAISPVTQAVPAPG